MFAVVEGFSIATALGLSVPWLFYPSSHCIHNCIHCSAVQFVNTPSVPKLQGCARVQELSPSHITENFQFCQRALLSRMKYVIPNRDQLS